MDNSFIIFSTNIGIFLLGYFLGQYRKSTDKEEIEDILNISREEMSRNFGFILDEFQKKLEVINYENSKSINVQNEQAMNTFNHQIEVFNKVFQLLSDVNSTLESQTELYQRINMLQKIIVKKKKLDNK